MSQAIENFGKYLLLERLAAGGMAEVFLAKSQGASGVSKFLAVKRILPQYSENEEFIQMFKEEAKIAVNLNHSNVVSIFDFGMENKQFYLAMEFVEGQNLRQILNHIKKENKHFSIDQIVYMIKEAAAGLDHAHRCLDGTTGKSLNIIHRDISPQNIMVSFEGEVKIVDFGIAKAESQMENTRAGTIKGKFGYMSPEQADGLPIDLRTDVFSLGIVLWELLANERLFTASSEAATLRKIRECQIPSIRKLNPAIPIELERIVNKSLTKDRSLRYASAAHLHKDLNLFLNTQYPAFSTHEFSHFMKSSFAQMYLDNRKKLTEYAKVQTNEDKTMVADTITSTETNAEDNSFEFANKSLKVDLNKLAIKSNSNIKSISIQNPNSAIFVPQGTSTNIRRAPPAPPKKNSTDHLLVGFLLAIIVAAGGGYVWKSEYREMVFGSEERSPTERASVTQPIVNQPAVTQVVESSSTAEPVPVVIQSQPSGAQVFIDDRVTPQMTPARLTLALNKTYKITLKKPGHLPYEINETILQSGQSIQATLQPAMSTAVLNLRVKNAGVSAYIVINGTRLSEKLPLSNYVVPADQPVQIEVINPLTQLRASTVMKFKANETKDLDLFLTERVSTVK